MATGERAMQLKMQEVFAEAGKAMKFEKNRNGVWTVTVNGRELGYGRYESEAFQQALDASGIGGEIEYYAVDEESKWVFNYIPKGA